jgi:hypothetical protein
VAMTTTSTDAAPADAASADAVLAEAPPTDAILEVEIDAGDIEMPPVDISRPPSKQPGMLSIDSTPWATIYIDGTSLGITPIVKRSLPAGRHKLRAVLKDGRVKEQTIDIPAGRLAKPIQLTW